MINSLLGNCLPWLADSCLRQISCYVLHTCLGSPGNIALDKYPVLVSLTILLHGSSLHFTDLAVGFDTVIQ